MEPDAGYNYHHSISATEILRLEAEKRHIAEMIPKFTVEHFVLHHRFRMPLIPQPVHLCNHFLPLTLSGYKKILVEAVATKPRSETYAGIVKKSLVKSLPAPRTPIRRSMITKQNTQVESWPAPTPIRRYNVSVLVSSSSRDKPKGVPKRKKVKQHESSIPTSNTNTFFQTLTQLLALTPTSKLIWILSTSSFPLRHILGPRQ